MLDIVPTLGGLKDVQGFDEARVDVVETPRLALAQKRLQFGEDLLVDGQIVEHHEQNDIWSWELERRVLTRLTFSPAVEQYATWTPDGSRVVFGMEGGMFSHASDGSGAITPVAPAKETFNRTPSRPMAPA